MAKKRKKSKLKKRIIQGVVLAALLGGLAWVFIPGAVPVQIDEARIGSLSSTVEAEGRTRARERYQVWAPVTATVQRLPLSPGNPVVRDQVIARLIPDALALGDPQTTKTLTERIAAAEAARARAATEREQAVAALDQARADLRSTEDLAAAGQATAVQRDQAQVAVKLAFKNIEMLNSALQSAAFDIEAAQSALQQIKQGATREWIVRSPLNGTVLDIPGNGTVTTGAPLMDIGNPRDIEVVAEITVAEAEQLQPGQRAVLTPVAGEGALEGRVRRTETIAPPEAPDATASRALVQLEFVGSQAKWRELGEGRAVRVRITTSVVDGVVKVPLPALVMDGKQAVVYVMDGSRARKRSVTLGARNADEVVIASGVKDYERVILAPDARIKDGVRVKRR